MFCELCQFSLTYFVVWFLSPVYVGATRPTVLPSTRSVGHKGKMPSTAEASFVAPNASVIGDVKVGYSYRRGVVRLARVRCCAASGSVDIRHGGQVLCEDSIFLLLVVGVVFSAVACWATHRAHSYPAVGSALQGRVCHACARDALLAVLPSMVKSSRGISPLGFRNVWCMLSPQAWPCPRHRCRFRSQSCCRIVDIR